MRKSFRIHWNGETEIELAGHHGFPAVVHLPGLGRSLADHLNHPLRIQVGPAGKIEGFRKALDQSGDGDLVDHLGQLAASGAAHEFDRPREAADQRFGPLERFGIAAHHDGQLSPSAPACPPDTGASRHRTPRSAPAEASSLAMSAEAVV